LLSRALVAPGFTAPFLLAIFLTLTASIALPIYMYSRFGWKPGGTGIAPLLQMYFYPIWSIGWLAVVFTHRVQVLPTMAIILLLLAVVLLGLAIWVEQRITAGRDTWQSHLGVRRLPSTRKTDLAERPPYTRVSFYLPLAAALLPFMAVFAVVFTLLLNWIAGGNANKKTTMELATLVIVCITAIVLRVERNRREKHHK
jgi:hypothetical protein